MTLSDIPNVTNIGHPSKYAIKVNKVSSDLVTIIHYEHTAPKLSNPTSRANYQRLLGSAIPLPLLVAAVPENVSPHKG
jgi:hypothetical protein